MKIFHKIYLGLTVALMGCFLASCDLTPDVAPLATYEGTANTTIADLLVMHQIGSSDSYVHISEDSADIIISGIVTSSDEHGNCYKYICIEDSTGGIQIQINNTALFNKYRLGQRVFVKCNGLDLGDYRKLPQMGIWLGSKMEHIPNNKTYMYIFNDGAPVEPQPTITLTSVPASANDLPASYFNRLVRLEGATFVDGGVGTFYDYYSKDIRLSGGGIVKMRTSNYADFSNKILPEGTGSLVGILTRYNNDIQFVIRSLDDVQGFPPSTETIFSVNNYLNAFNEGWSQVASGSSWNVLSNINFNGFYITGSEATDSWLVSPAIDLSSKGGANLLFTHRAPQGGDALSMRACYTANYTGDVHTTQWTEIPLDFSNTAGQDLNFAIPESALTSGFRIAYRFTSSNSSWYISNISITAFDKR